MSNNQNKNLIHKSLRPDLKVPNKVTLTDFVLNSEQKSQNLDFACFTDAVTKESVLHSEIHQTIPKVASFLYNDFGISKGDVVLMFSPNHVNFGAIVLSIIDLGAIMSAANYVYTANELSHLAKLVKPKVLITVPELFETAEKALSNASLHNTKLAFLTNEGCSKNSNIPNFKQIQSTKSYPKLKFQNSEESKKQIAAILFSSGTTGIPKGVMLSHYNLVANMLQAKDIMNRYYTKGAEFINILPFFHVYALMTDLLMIMYAHCSTNIIKRFDLKVYLEILNVKEINLAFVAPPVVVAFAKNPMVKNYKIQNLKAFISGAAPLSKELEDEILQKYGIKCGQAYGMTELSPLSHTDAIDEKRSGAAGRMAANMEQIVVDVDTGEYLGRNKRGELRLKGPNVMMGYYKNEQATKETFDENGFMKTGDIVYIDDDGYIYIVDRLKELIKVRGFQVPPAELEALLLTHPDVADACVIGVPCSKAGELPKGFITLKNPSASNKQKIIKSIHAYFGEHLAHYKQLKGGIEIIKEIPKSPSGKILRRKLRELGSNDGKAKL